MIRELPPLPEDGNETERASILKETWGVSTPKSDYCNCETCQVIQMFITPENIEQQEALVPDGYYLFSILQHTSVDGDNQIPGWYVYTNGKGFSFWSEIEALMIIVQVPHLLPILNQAKATGTQVIYCKIGTNQIIDKETLERNNYDV